MTIVAIADALLDGAMRARFHGDPIVQATELLLQERTPRDVAVALPWAAEAKAAAPSREITPSGGRRLTTAHTSTPATQLLSNGRYAVMVTAAGSGYSRWRDLAVTRWREDATCDDWGSYVFLRDVDSGKVWSAGFQPSGVEPDSYEVAFNEDRAEFTRHDGTLTTVQEIVVSAEDDAEVRRISLTNAGSARARDRTHLLLPNSCWRRRPPTSRIRPSRNCSCRPNILPTKAPFWRRGGDARPTSRRSGRRILRSSTARRSEKPKSKPTGPASSGAAAASGPPIAAIDGRPLSDTVGTVLDPVFALRRRVRVAPGATVRVAFWTMVAPTREALLDLVDKHRDTTAFERASTLAWTQAQVQLRHHRHRCPAKPACSSALRATCSMRPDAAAVVRSHPARHRSAVPLWPLGISGDLPILLLRIADSENLDLAHQMLQAHEYWRMKQSGGRSGDPERARILLCAGSADRDRDPGHGPASRGHPGRRCAPPGRVFVLRADLISSEARAHLLSVSRAVLVGQRGSLADQLDRVPDAEVATAPPPKHVAAEARRITGRGAGLGASRILQRSWRVLRSRPRICDDPRTGPVDTGAVDQCRRQSQFWISGWDRRRRQHLVGQQPRKPADAVVERSGDRPFRRSVLSAR